MPRRTGSTRMTRTRVTRTLPTRSTRAACVPSRAASRGATRICEKTRVRVMLSIPESASTADPDRPPATWIVADSEIPGTIADSDWSWRAAAPSLPTGTLVLRLIRVIRVMVCSLPPSRSRPASGLNSQARLRHDAGTLTRRQAAGIGNAAPRPRRLRPPERSPANRGPLPRQCPSQRGDSDPLPRPGAARRCTEAKTRH